VFRPSLSLCLTNNRPIFLLLYVRRKGKGARKEEDSSRAGNLLRPRYTLRIDTSFILFDERDKTSLS